MLIFYGWKTKLKQERTLGTKFCANCRHQANIYLAKETFRVHVFYIPVFMKTTRRFRLCSNCGIVEEYTRAEYNAKLMDPYYE